MSTPSGTDRPPTSSPYDDSFALGGIPGGDVLFQPPGNAGMEPPAPTVPREPVALPPQYQQSTYRPPSTPPRAPASWGRRGSSPSSM